MNPNSDEIALMRWLDGDMDATERAAFTARMESDPALRAEVEAMSDLGSMIRAELPRPAEVPHADFFNAQIQDRIDDERRAERREAERAADAAPAWLQWLRLPWLAGAALAVLAVVAGVNVLLPRGDKLASSATAVVSMYAPQGNIQPRTYHSAEANATVLVLDGLDAIPAERDLVARHVEHSQTSEDLALTTLHDAKGEVVLVLDIDGTNQPRVLAR